MIIYTFSLSDCPVCVEDRHTYRYLDCHPDQIFRYFIHSSSLDSTLNFLVSHENRGRLDSIEILQPRLTLADDRTYHSHQKIFTSESIKFLGTPPTIITVCVSCQPQRNLRNSSRKQCGLQAHMESARHGAESIQ